MLKIIVDSAADLPKEKAEKLQIQVIPTPIIIDGQTYLDGETIHFAELAGMLGSSGHDIKTHHVTPAMYEEAFLTHAQNGDSVLCLCFSTGLAGNYDAAKIGAISVKEKYPNFDITIWDSKSASGGYGMIAAKLARMVKKGKSKEEVLKAAEEYIARIQHLFTVSGMSYFMKGGRIAHALGSACNTLDLRPIFTLDDDGCVLLVKPMQGEHHAMNAIIDQMANSGIDFSQQTISVSYGNDESDKDYFINLIQEKLAPADIEVSTASCATAAHAGYRLIGVCYLNK